jgi:2-polyprenyl-3-methyl-5-hydroxy-6-metoxy-1,4-benzoquinol methylase
LTVTNECIVCGSSQASPLYPGILKCRQCGHIFADLLLSEDDLFKLYNKSYFFGDEYSDYVADKRIIQKNFKLRLKTLKAFLKPTLHNRLLEIGCAYGFFLEAAQRYFQKVQGIDITADGINYAREVLHLNAVQDDVLKHDFEGQKFDVVCMWDTIEHLCHPHLYIEKMSQHMDSGALLTITTGDIESWNARLRKDKWRLIHPPTHVHYFSKKTLAKMLDQYGFDVVYQRHCGFYRSVDNIAYNIFVLRQKRPKLYEFLKRLKLTKLDFYLNLYDILYVVARKR